MSNNRRKGADLERNERKMALFARNYGKKSNIDFDAAEYHAKIDELAKNLVKTRISVDSEASDVEFRDKLLSEWLGKPADSTPNPNKEFKRLKGHNTTNTSYLRQLDRHKRWLSK